MQDPCAPCPPLDPSSSSAAPLVRIADVSNGCGSSGLAEQLQHRVANEHTYTDTDSPLDLGADSFTVDFRPACDLHDAGYVGAVVEDRLNCGVKDFRNWTRKQVDDAFLANLRLMCTCQIPAGAAAARDKCKTDGEPGGISVISDVLSGDLRPAGLLPFGARSLYDIVRRLGRQFFRESDCVSGPCNRNSD